MRFFPGLRLAARAVTIDQQHGTLPAIGSPWSGESHLSRVLISDLLPDSAKLPIDRPAAMTVPSITKARALIVEQLAHRPLRLIDDAHVEQPAPSWFHETGVLGASVWHRMADTIDDLIFYGASVWMTARSSSSTSAPIHYAHRCPREQWRITDAGVLEVTADGKTWTAPSADQAIYIRGPQDGLLTLAEGTIRGALDIERTWRGRARTPAPLMIVEEADPLQPLSEAEIKEYLTEFRAARADPDGAVMFLPSSLKLRLEGKTETDLLTNGRNAVKLDAAAFLNLPSAALDATLEKSSLTYETADGKRGELGDRLAYWTGAIESRLSMDDVCAPGHRIRFDMTRHEPSTGLPTED